MLEALSEVFKGWQHKFHPKEKKEKADSIVEENNVVTSNASSSEILRYTVFAYVDLVRSGALQNDGSLFDYSQGQRSLYGQPEQDPLGVLTCTLFFLKCNKIKSLTWKSRQIAAVTLTCFHKIATSKRGKRSCTTIENVVRRFLLPHEELAVTNLDELVNDHIQLELFLVTKYDLLAFYQSSPIAGAEERLWELLEGKYLNEKAIVLIRGVIFFFIGLAFLSGDNEVFTDATIYEIGVGATGLAIICARAAMYKILDSTELKGTPRTVAIKLLKISLASDELRTGSYANKSSAYATGNIVSRENLQLVAQSFGAFSIQPRA